MLVEFVDYGLPKRSQLDHIMVRSNSYSREKTRLSGRFNLKKLAAALLENNPSGSFNFYLSASVCLTWRHCPMTPPAVEKLPVGWKLYLR